MKYLKQNVVYDNVVMTPPDLAKKIVDHLKPSGKLLEPCRGSGSFYNAMLPYGEVDWCEITEGKDFLEYQEHVDWIITNPPWSNGMLLKFLIHSMEVADNVVFLTMYNHFTTSRRIKEIMIHNFGFKELVYVDTPKGFPIMGFQLVAGYIQRNYSGAIAFTNLMEGLPR